MPGKKKSKSTTMKRSFYCQKCQRRVRIPQGWTQLPSVRKHYWAKHPEVMGR